MTESAPQSSKRKNRRGKKETPDETRYEDIVQPFLIEDSSLRGRIVRLGPALQGILHRHDYPACVSRQLGELLVLAALLYSTLKYRGVFTMQVSGDGPVAFMVADVTHSGELRGYAEIDADDPLFYASNDDASHDMTTLLGEGYLAITVDQGDERERYQGIVSLEGATLSECVASYFRQSEQIGVALRVEVGHSREDGGERGDWEGAALLLQRLPGQSRKDKESNIVFLDFAPDTSASYSGEQWNRAVTFMRSATRYELLDPFLSPADLLYRLFHEDGVRVFEPVSVKDQCRCSRERIFHILGALPKTEMEEMIKEGDGEITVSCQFCNRQEIFTAEDFSASPENG